MELFLNSVPILAPLTRDEKLLLLDALEEQVYGPGVRVINQVCSCTVDFARPSVAQSMLSGCSGQ